MCSSDQPGDHGRLGQPAQRSAAARAPRRRGGAAAGCFSLASARRHPRGNRLQTAAGDRRPGCSRPRSADRRAAAETSRATSSEWPPRSSKKSASAPQARGRETACRGRAYRAASSSLRGAASGRRPSPATLDSGRSRKAFRSTLPEVSRGSCGTNSKCAGTMYVRQARAERLPQRRGAAALLPSAAARRRPPTARCRPAAAWPRPRRPRPAPRQWPPRSPPVPRGSRGSSPGRRPGPGNAPGPPHRSAPGRRCRYMPRLVGPAPASGLATNRSAVSSGRPR